MVFFITLLRAIATCLITNSHYTGIYPTDLFASGGLIGDVIFFAVSGYCLYRVKGDFFHWYKKRVARCYLPVIVITAIYMLLGCYSLSEHSLAWWFLYPTYYHFVASIVVLYIPFYLVMRYEALQRRIPHVMLGVLALCLIVYLLPIYDKSYYHIDTVREPMIRFLFFESMLLGAYFRQAREAACGFRWRYLVGTVGCFILYFASKLIFSRVASISGLQILNWFTIFALLYFVFALFASLEGKYERLPKWVSVPVRYLASITLEIYVVQYVLIAWIRPHLPFPLNWLAITASILASATALHYACEGIRWGVFRAALALDTIKKKEKL